MSIPFKNQRALLDKLNIDQLNPMQEEAKTAIHKSDEVVLLSPTGSGKTLAFLLPLISEMDRSIHEIQSLILVPTRELALQIEQVVLNMGSGFKVNAAYGGQSFNQDRINLKHRPAILVGTPGRIADHIRRHTFDLHHISYLVLDEFDKSLEIGFEKEMNQILASLTELKKKVLTSATHGVIVPEFVELNNPVFLNFLDDSTSKLELRSIISPNKDKLETLYKSLDQLKGQSGIVFLNFKDSIHRVSEFLMSRGIPHGCFYGGMEQKEREESLIKFRNGTHQIILATDLAARGLDIPELDFILHYHLPNRPEEFTHRNGRTARMHKEGVAYVLLWENETAPDFIGDIPSGMIGSQNTNVDAPLCTLRFTAGKRAKISKGDIVGFLIKSGGLLSSEIGVIELKQDSSYVAIPQSKSRQILHNLNGKKIKRVKVKITEI